MSHPASAVTFPLFHLGVKQSVENGHYVLLSTSERRCGERGLDAPSVCARGAFLARPAARWTGDLGGFLFVATTVNLLSSLPLRMR